jgi:hypothetical protein
MKGEKVLYRRGYVFQTVNDITDYVAIFPPKSLVFKWAILSDNGFMTIIHDYAWNGMSGIHMNIKSSIRGVLFHDVTYQMIRLGFLDIKWKPQADLNLRNFCIEDGMLTIAADIIHAGVKEFGLSSTAPKAEPPVMEAP